LAMKLHDWLKKHGKTATWLAEQTGLNASYVYRLVEKNGVAERSPSIETCVKIAKATDGEVTVVDFLPEPKPTHPSTREVSRAA
jgi:transcriptional regulator with XRE-family HTH domain